MINLEKRYLEMVKGILKRIIPDHQILVFGSRVKGQPKKYSDLDLVIRGVSPLTPRAIYDLQEAFDESDLPIRVDLLDWHELSKEFQEEIQKNYVILQEADFR